MTTTPSGRRPESEPAFRVEAFLNEHLAEGTGNVDVIATVTATGEPVAQAPASERAEVIIIDRSGSMYGRRKMEEAKAAAVTAVDCLEDGTGFAVVAGDHRAVVVYPTEPEMAAASPASRAAAREAIGRLTADGGTTIGLWLDEARTLFSGAGYTACHAILLTDGINEGQTPAELDKAIERATGKFQCDCRGVGTDWDVTELRKIADALLGSVELVPRPDELAQDFRAIVTLSQSRTLPNIRLRLWTPQGATVDMVRQVSPEILDLTERLRPHDARHSDILLGGWTPGETREYHLRILIPARDPGIRALAGRVKLVSADDGIAGEEKIEVRWTTDRELSTPIHARVAHFTGQAEMAAAIDRGMASLKEGDEHTATVQLGRAARLARESGHTDTLRALRRVVDVDDRKGTVKLRKGAGKEDRMTLEVRSRRTIRTRKGRELQSGNRSTPKSPEGGT